MLPKILEMKEQLYIGECTYNDKSPLPGGKLVVNSPTCVCGSGA